MDELNNNENEQNSEIKTPPKNFALGALGALIGAFVASIPWILMYVYGNMILSALAIIVAIGALKGYQILKGPIDKKLPVVISITSLLAVVVATLFIIPMLLLIQEGYPATIDNLKVLYAYDEFLAGIMQDLIVSVVFTVLGISGVVANVNRKIKESKTPLDKISISDSLASAPVNNDQVVNNVKDVFVKYNAMSKQDAISKETILQELQEVENGKKSFNTLKTQQIIRRYRGNYYFSEKAEKNFGYRFGLVFIKVLLIMVIFVAILIPIMMSAGRNSDNKANNTTRNTTYNNNSYTTKSKTHELSDFGIKIVTPSKMTFVNSEKDLTYLLGSDAGEFYEFAIYNQTHLISCFIKEASEEEIDAYYDSLKDAFADYTILSDYKKETISGFEFTTIEAQTTNKGVLYNDLGLGYYKDGKFVFFEYTYPDKDKAQAKKNIENMINKM